MKILQDFLAKLNKVMVDKFFQNYIRKFEHNFAQNNVGNINYATKISAHSRNRGLVKMTDDFF